MEPYRIRFMTEVGCDFALWGDPWRPLPLNGDEDAEDLENVLPISDDLRLRILDGRAATAVMRWRRTPTRAPGRWHWGRVTQMFASSSPSEVTLMARLWNG